MKNKEGIARRVVLFGYKDEEGNISSVHEPTKLKKRKRGNFFMGDNCSFTNLSLCRELTKIDLRLLLHFLSKMDYSNNVMITQKSLADTLGVEPALISRSIKNLEEHSYVMKGKLNGVTCFHVNEELADKGGTYEQ